MDQSKMRIGIVDESDSDRREFRDFFEGDFEVVMIPIGSVPEESFENILEARVDAVAIDFLLTENNSGIPYNGSKIFEILEERLPHFPFFIFTHMPAQAELENSDQFRIINKSVYATNETLEELKRRIKNQIRIYYQSLAEGENRLIELIEKQKTTQLSFSEENEMIRLDDFLEHSLSAKSNIPSSWKRPNGLETLDFLASEVTKLIGKLNEQSDD